MIADIMGINQYKAELSRLGIKDVTKKNLGWRVWWTGPWMSTTLISGTKNAVKQGV